MWVCTRRWGEEDRCLVLDLFKERSETILSTAGLWFYSSSKLPSFQLREAPSRVMTEENQK